jgi:hypothetical protein
MSTDIPDFETRRFYEDHGVVFTGVRGDEVFGPSPFGASEKTDKLHVNIATGAWHDKVLGTGGGPPQLLSLLQEHIYGPALTIQLRKKLALRRGFPLTALDPFLDHLGYDSARQRFTILVRDAKGRPTDIRRYNPTAKLGPKMRSTAGAKAGLCNVAALLASAASVPVYIVEGEWDCVALTFLLSTVGAPGVVVALPGVGTFKAAWASLFTGRHVTCLFDADTAGKRGDATVWTKLRGVAASVAFLHWPDGALEGFDISEAVSAAVEGGSESDWWTALQGAFKVEPRVAPTSDASGTPGPDPDAKLVAAHVYSVGTKRFFQLETLQPYDKEQFDALHATTHPLQDRRTRPASIAFLNHADSRRVAKPTYRPGEGRFVTEDGQDALNLYRPSLLVPEEGDVTPFVEHARYLIPDKKARGVVLDWMAYLVQHPDRKQNWALFIGGAQGIGKDTLFEPLRYALGDHNVGVIGPDSLDDGWTDWLKDTKLLLVEEFAVFEKKPLMNRLKALVTSPPTKLRINGKFVPQYYIPNLASFVFFSNYHDALKLDADDRRFFVYWSPVEKREPRYYQDLYAWLRAHSGRVFHYLLHRDVSAFDAVGHAPMTASKREVIKESQSPLEQFLRHTAESNERPLRGDLVVLSKLVDALPAHVGRVSLRAVAACLKRMGAVQLKRQMRLRDGSRPHVWALRSADAYEHLSEPALSAAYEREHQSGRSGLRVVP